MQCTRMFGSAPKHTTYALDWRFFVSRISGEMQPHHVDHLQRMAQCLQMHIIDKDNMLVPETALPYISAVSFCLQSLDVQILKSAMVLRLALPHGVLIQTDTFASLEWTSRLFAQIPFSVIQLLVLPVSGLDSSDSRRYAMPWLEVLSLSISNFESSAYALDKDLAMTHEHQKQFVLEHDEQRMRCQYMYDAQNIPEYRTDEYRPSFRFIEKTNGNASSFIDLGHDSST